MLLEARGGVLRSFPPGLEEMAVGLRVGQLDGLDPAEVVVVPGPLAVARLLGEGGLKHELVRLIVEVVVEIVPQQAVDENGLRIIQSCPASCQSETRSPVLRNHS